MTFQDWIKSPICTVRFAGWESTTVALQQAGWAVSARQNISHYSVGLALHHPQTGLYAVTDDITMPALWRPKTDFIPHDCVVFNVIAMSTNLRCTYVPMYQSAFAYSPIDCFPSTYQSAASDQALQDLVPFKTVNHDATQIVIAPASVPQVLELLLRCQAPAAAVRRAEDRKREVRRASDIQAQVLVEVA